MKDTSIPFALKSDTDAFVHVGTAGKVPTCVANMACDAAAKLGLTELAMDDHAITQVLDKDPFSHLSSNPYLILSFIFHIIVLL